MLILGVDGGGSKTVARLAAIGSGGRTETLGEGHSGPSNVRAVGAEDALANLDKAINQALAVAGKDRPTVAYAVLALAGSSLADVQAIIKGWANERELASQIDLVHDIDPVLAAGLPDQHGVALIVGTGSVAVGIDCTGERVKVGGWGHWFGDQGSGYHLGRRALAAVAAAVDGLGPSTALEAQILRQLKTENPREIARILASAADTRQAIAALAPIVLAVAQANDSAARLIINEATASTAALVVAAANRSGLKGKLPLALAGGIVCSSSLYRELLIENLVASALIPEPVTLILEPVTGSVIMARQRLTASQQR